jgi:predicted hydrolase (HD superfamily)
MMILEEARNRIRAHLGSSKRAEHSIFVGYVMRCVAERLGADAQLWEVVGLCHDLDYFETADDKRRHGVLVADWLAKDLSLDALDAIRAHDHRSGIQANTTLANALKLADALAVADVVVGRETIVRLLDINGGEGLRALLADRPYLPDMIIDFSQRLHLRLSELAFICGKAPPQ